MSGDIPFPKPKPAQLFGEPLGARTIDPADAYAPTPAATAREALARAMLAATGVPWEMTEVSVRDAYLDEADAILAALPDGWTLAAAEAPGRGRVAALEEEARLVSQWADAVDQMPTELRGELYDLGVHARAALAAPASPAGVSGEVHHEGRCDRCGGVNVVWWADHDLWNAAGRTDGSDEWPFLCPSCFASVAEERGVVPAHTVWKMVPNGEVAQRTEPEVSTLPVAGSTPALPATIADLIALAAARAVDEALSVRKVADALVACAPWVESAGDAWHVQVWLDEDVMRIFEDGSFAAALVAHLRGTDHE